MVKIEVEVDEFQAKLIDGLMPFFGGDRAAVLRRLFLIWIEQNISNPKLGALQEIGAIKGFD